MKQGDAKRISFLFTQYVGITMAESTMHRAEMSVYMRAVASKEHDHPLQTRIQLILTDFAPNKNKQGIPLEEADNIIRTALYSPLKINFNGKSFKGHAAAKPLGPIVSAWKGKDTLHGEERDVIIGEAVVWTDLYKEVAEHLIETFDEGIGGSWEIYYAKSDIREDTEWLRGCIFAGTVIVDTPAYGPERTRLLAIAECLNGDDNSMAKNATEDVKVEVKLDEESTKQLEELRTNLDNLTKEFSELNSKYTALATEKEAADNKVKELEEKISAEELAKAEEEKYNSRKTKLNEAGFKLDNDDRRKFILGLSEEDFEVYVNDIKSLQVSKASASINTNNEKKVIPEPLTERKEDDVIQKLKDYFNS